MSIQSAGLLQPSMASQVSMKGARPGEPMSQEMAQEFESLMLSQLMKQMRQSSGGEGLFPGDKSDTYGGMFDMMIGKYLSESGGFGLADHLAGSFDGTGPDAASQFKTASLVKSAGQPGSTSAATVQQAQETYQSMNAVKESPSE